MPSPLRSPLLSPPRTPAGGAMKRHSYLLLKLALIFLFYLIAAVAAQPSCETWLQTPAAQQRYKQILASLTRRTAPSTISNLECFVPPGYSLTTKSPKVVYSKVVRESFHPSILYYSLRDALEAALLDDLVDGHMTLAWPGGYVAEAAVVGFQKSRQTRFLDLFVSYFDRVVALRDDKVGKADVYHGRVMRAWGAQELGPSAWVAFPTPNARILYSATLFAVVVRADPALQAKYGAAADRYVAVAEETLAEFDGDWRRVAGSANTSWYHLPYSAQGFPLRLDPINHIHLVGNVWLNLHKLTGKFKYRTRVQNTIKVFLKSVVKGPNDTVHWNYFPYFATKEKTFFSDGRQFSEYMWKVSLTAPFLIRAKNQGYTLPAYLVPAITKTLSALVFRETKLLRNLSPVDSIFMEPVGGRPDQLSKARNVVVLVEWPSMAKEVTALVANRPDIFMRAWSTNMGLLAYARLLPQS